MTVRRNDDGTVFVEGLWASGCHPVEDGMDIEVPDNVAIVDKAAIVAYINRAEYMQCGEFHGATWPKLAPDYCGDDHALGLTLLARVGGEIARVDWDEVVAALGVEQDGGADERPE